jgi:hypothetical protein
MGVQENQDGMKLNSTQLDRSMRTIERNMEALVVTSKEIGLEVNADKTKYMVMS